MQGYSPIPTAVNRSLTDHEAASAVRARGPLCKAAAELEAAGKHFAPPLRVAMAVLLSTVRRLDQLATDEQLGEMPTNKCA
jgi:hypothetical protein